MAKWLITGAGGFLGQTVTQQLTANGADFTTLRIGKSAATVGTSNSVMSLSTSVESISQALKGHTFDYVLNLAAAGVHPQDRDPKTLEDINITLPASLVKLSDDIGQPAYVLAGSCSEYAAPTGEDSLRETAPHEDTKLYGKTKATGNQNALSIAENNSARAITARIFNLYGPGESKHRLVPSLLNALINGQSAQLSDGLQVRDFMHVEDASKYLIVLAKALKTSAPSSPQSINVCTGIGTRVKDVAIIACHSAGFPLEALDFGAIERRPDDIAHMVGDPGKLHSYLGDHSFMSVKDGIHAYVQGILNTDTMRQAALS